MKGEQFLARTQRLPAEILIIEGWIGREGIEAAKVEFERGHYAYLVTGGGISKNDWDNRQWNYAEEAGKLLVNLGVPADKVIEAPAQDVKTQRTFTTAIAVRRTLANRGLKIDKANIFTIGAHARRSRLVFAKVFPYPAQIGVVSFSLSSYRPEPWWKSSERADTFIKETVGYLFELLLNSGRTTNEPVRP